MTVEVRCFDARNLSIAPDAYDVMIVDPPYSAHVHASTTSQSVGGGTRPNDLGFAHLSEDLRAAIARLASGVSRWSIVYSDIEGLHDWRKACEAERATYIRAMPWVRWSMPQLSGDRPPQGFELVTAYWGHQKGRKSWNGPGNLTHLDHKCLRGEGKHKCEKPLDQALDLVSWFSNPGDWVLDPCAGSGVVGLACRLLGRHCRGYEIDPVWADKAQTRLMGALSERDEERLDRWKQREGERAVERMRIKANTDKQRAKLEAKKCASSE
jgi:hypothetical protein